MNEITITREATEEENKAIQIAIEALSTVGLEMIGTRPRRERG